ncbi:LysR family transcriptional regulator [Actinopolyspora saharensis]|uniref:DNA-binding transcriptional regulator, LysR family n=1 Tax=Actinopolyspora saharensis TaxID=995062 RepID=A0A1H0ZR22_9ACTN|nr:LysR family transcriptional regulator [Actinopolyspora saharensis]SDQ29476.1 DNA-binding transcriptional regulator, LysR family [Actinopolyspora saharensis]
MSEVTLAGLRVVVEVARRGSFTATAEALRYTQSAVSRQVGVTEDAVGSPLFERKARGVRPTPAGEALLRHARQVVAHLEAAELEIAGLRDRVAGHLTVGAYPTAAAALVPQAIARLHTAHPALEVDLREAGSPTQMRWLQAGRIEVALVAVGNGLPAYDFTGLRTETIRTGRGLGLAVSADHPLAAHDEVHADDLAEQVWIVGAGKEGEPQFGAWPTLTRPTIGYKARSWQTRLGLVAAGLGVSVLPGMAADTVPRGVKWLRVQDTAFVQQRETVLVTAAERSAAASAFVQAVRDELATFAEATVPPS